MPRRVIITGPNSAGKSHFAQRLSLAWPGVAVVHYDALKLTTGWVQRPRAESDALLAERITGEEWIVEGGPSLLPVALTRAEAVVWLDPPLLLRGWRLAVRPWTHRGRTRPELPEGNPDRVAAQYRFALRSLRADAEFRASVLRALDGFDPARLWRCQRRKEVDAALDALRNLNS